MKQATSHSREMGLQQAAARADAHHVVAILNGDVSANEAQPLRDYCDAWMRAGRSFVEMQDHRHAVNDHLRQWRLWCLGSGVEEMNEPTPPLPPGLILWNPPECTDGRPALAYGIEGSAYNAASRAALRFGLLITSPEGQLLGRCPRCRRYFLNTSGHRNKVFCRPECARDIGARRATRRARTLERDVKLRRALSAVGKLNE